MSESLITNLVFDSNDAGPLSRADDSPDESMDSEDSELQEGDDNSDN